MINITFNPDKYELTVEGHANYGEKGEDIVCAAISTLFYTLGEAIFQSADMLTEEPTFKDNDGKGYLICHPKKEFEGNIARTYWTILTGMEMVADNYPKNVTLEVGG
jgi:uncharacterized protein YsxB (DUF464 family)